MRWSTSRGGPVDVLGYLDKGKRKRKEKAGSLQWAYMAIARLGGFMDSKRTGIASWGALW